MNIIKHSIGIRTAVITIISIFLIFLNSCSKDIDSYQFSIRNEYFEPLYQTKVGAVFFDTILVNELTPLAIINRGAYDFTTETESGLILTTNITFQGESQYIKLIVNKNGKLTIE